MSSLGFARLDGPGPDLLPLGRRLLQEEIAEGGDVMRRSSRDFGWSEGRPVEENAERRSED